MSSGGGCLPVPEADPGRGRHVHQQAAVHQQDPVPGRDNTTRSHRLHCLLHINQGRKIKIGSNVSMPLNSRTGLREWQQMKLYQRQS